VQVVVERILTTRLAFCIEALDEIQLNEGKNVTIKVSFKWALEQTSQVNMACLQEEEGGARKRVSESESETSFCDSH
jgi:hypothetical protein